MLKYLRIGVTGLCLTASVLLVALWVRSYWYSDIIYRADASGSLIAMKSNYGALTFLQVNTSITRDWVIQLDSRPSTKERQAFFWDDNGDVAGIMVPFWAMAMPLALLAVVTGIPGIPWSKRFSLRTLLIATTLVALGLGMIVYLAG
jgi:hypothetical protein